MSSFNNIIGNLSITTALTPLSFSLERTHALHPDYEASTNAQGVLTH